MASTNHQNPVLNWLGERKLFVEIFLMAVALGVYLLTASSILEGNSILMISLFALSVFYFAGAFLTGEYDSLYALIAIKVAGISSAIAMIGIAFAMLGFQGAKQQLLIGLTSLVVAVIILMTNFLRNQKQDYLVIIVRGLALIAIGYYFFTQPNVH